MKMMKRVIEELGDVLLQVFLHAQIGEDDGYFAMEDVLAIGRFENDSPPPACVWR